MTGEKMSNKYTSRSKWKYELQMENKSNAKKRPITLPTKDRLKKAMKNG